MRSWANDAAPQRLEMAVDQGCTAFVDYLSFWMDEEHDRKVFEHVLLRHRDAIAHELTRSHAPDIRRKFEWLAAYHNWVITTRLTKGRRFLIGGVEAGAFSRFS
jgi:hypothetical protein